MSLYHTKKISLLIDHVLGRSEEEEEEEGEGKHTADFGLFFFLHLHWRLLNQPFESHARINWEW